MARRSEPRIAVLLPVVVRGLDSRGSPFVVTTETHEFSCSGACLQGLNGVAERGTKVEIECQNQKAWYRVQWVGKPQSSKAGWTGVRCLEPGKHIWGVTPKEWEADIYDPVRPRPVVPPVAAAPLRHAVRPQPAGQERRQFPRHACRIEAEVTPQGHSSSLPGKITDIALGGCYVETLTPLPVETSIKLVFGQEDTTVRVTGMVRSSQMGFGMGVLFTGMSPENFEKLRRLIFSTEASATPSKANAPAPAEAPPVRRPQPEPRAPRVASRPASAREFDLLDPPDVRETLAAVVRILCRKELLTRSELLEELERLKPARTR
jgi:PilZ domain